MLKYVTDVIYSENQTAEFSIGGVREDQDRSPPQPRIITEIVQTSNLKYVYPSVSKRIKVCLSLRLHVHTCTTMCACFDPAASNPAFACCCQVFDVDVGAEAAQDFKDETSKKQRYSIRAAPSNFNRGATTEREYSSQYPRR